MKKILEKLGNSNGGAKLTSEDIRDAVTTIMEGKATQAQIGAFLMGLKLHGEHPSMVATCAATMRDHSIKCHVGGEITDIVGTGGDGLDTFNVSTAAAVVGAACGLRVAKHGNRSSSSACGSADILEQAGANLDLDPEDVKAIVDDCGFCFLFAQKFHPAMKHVASARREVGVRTMFNLVGPLTNPASPSTCLIGVGSPAVAELVAETLRLQGVTSAMVVCGDHGLDEISPEGPTMIWVLKNDTITPNQITPSDFGLPVHTLAAVKGGTPDVNLGILQNLLNNTQGPYLDWVAMNAGALLVVNGKAAGFQDGVRMAKEAIASGKAKEVFERFVALTVQHKKPKAT